MGWREQLHEDLSADLNRIASRFKPGAKLTLVVRMPELPGDTSVVIGNDELDEAVAAILHRQRLDG